MRPYAKMSAPLVELRQIERKTVLAKMYGAARMFQARANALQELETRNAQRNARDDIIAQRFALLRQYEEQVERIRTYRDKIIAALEMKKKEEENGMQIRMANLQLQKQRLKERRPASALVRKVVSCGDPAKLLGVRSPRTREAYNVFRRGGVVRKLVIKTYSDFAVPRRGLLPRLPPMDEEEQGAVDE
jgi:hypothetical protein